MVHCGLRRANRKFKYSKLRVKGKSLTTRPTKQMQCWLYLEILWKKQGFKVAVFDSRFIFVFKDGISPLCRYWVASMNDGRIEWSGATLNLSALSHSAKSSSKISNSSEKMFYPSYFQTQCPRNHYLIVQGFLLDEWKNS